MDRLPNAEEICTELLREAKCTPPPTDLGAISSLWPSLKISEADLDKEGYLVFLGVRGAELMLRRADPLRRKRFTLAHELGHWVLSNTREGRFSLHNSSPVVHSIHVTRQSSEEMWCNDFAARLLMPTSEIRRYVEGNPEEIPGRLHAGPEIFRVSEQAFLSRIVDALGWIVVELFHGTDLHRVGRRFFRRRDSANSSNDDTIEELLRQTRERFPFPDGSIRVSGFVAYGTRKTVTRQASLYLVCLIPEDSENAQE